MKDHKFWVADAGIYVRCDDSATKFKKVELALRKAGYKVGPCPRVVRDYPSIADGFRRITGESPAGQLECEAKVYPAGFEFNCYQSVVTMNKAGGLYDFDKLSKMPFLIRMRWLHFRRVVSAKLEEIGLAYSPSRNELPTIQARYMDGWGFHKSEIGPDGWLSEEKLLRSWPYKTADGVRPTQGMTAYVRSRYTGRWKVGRMYGGVNGMWHLFGADDDFLANENAGSYYASPPGPLTGRQFDKGECERKFRRDFQAALNGNDYRRVSSMAKAAGRLGYKLIG